jgi:hypothetical protein
MPRACAVLLVAVGIIVVFFCGLSLSHWVLPHFLGASYQSAKLFDGFAGGLLASIVTFALFAIAYLQLGGLARTASAEFVVKLKQDVFTREMRTLFQLVENEWLTLKGIDEDNRYFSVETEKIDNSGLPGELKAALKSRLFYSEYEIDDLLLGHFEDIGLLVKKEVLAFDMVYEEFSYYIELVGRNVEIRKYMALQNTEDPTLYSNFLSIYEQCRRRTEKRK